MDQTIQISSLRNRRVVEARKLGQRKYRRRHGRFLVEGLQLLYMALDAGRVPLEVFFCPELLGEHAAALVQRYQSTDAKLLPVTDKVIEALSERDALQGVVATFATFEGSLTDIRPRERELILVVDRLQDPGNLGTLMRTADAVGATAVVLIEPCVDPFDPKVVRGTMGSLFNLPIIRTADPADLFEWLKAQHIRAVGAHVYQGSLWGEGLWDGRVALVLGNEARGLSDDVNAHLEYWARLPMEGQAESLNVAVAGGVLMYAWLRARLGG